MTSVGDRPDDEVVCIGETMVAFVPGDDPRTFVATAAGAESNVAIGLSRLGVPARWVSRLGDDPLGALVADEVERSGVSVDVVVDTDRPTGVLIRMRTSEGTTTTYHRRDSAASALGPADIGRIGSPGWVHVTGITAALSERSGRMVSHLVERRGLATPTVSFDVNHRPALWPDLGTAVDVLSALAARADVVLIGDDEATRLFGTADTMALADRFGIGPGRELVVKRGAAGAELLAGDRIVWERGLDVPVVDEAGAGDAFAAGFIAGTLGGWSDVDRLRLGHVMGAATVGVHQDHAPPLPESAGTLPDPAWLAERFAIR